MKTIYITLKVLYGIIVIEASETQLVTYNLYEGETLASGYTIYDFAMKEVFQFSKLEDTVITYDLDSFIEERIKPNLRNEELSVNKSRDVKFLNNFNGVETVFEYEVESILNVINKKGRIRVKKIMVDDLGFSDLNWSKNNLSLLPFIGSSILDRNKFSVSAYDITNCKSNRAGILMYELTEINTMLSYSNIALKAIEKI